MKGERLYVGENVDDKLINELSEGFIRFPAYKPSGNVIESFGEFRRYNPQGTYKDFQEWRKAVSEND